MLAVVAPIVGDTTHSGEMNVSTVHLENIALVTGAGKRLGRSIALGLAASGWDVAIHYGTSVTDAQQTVQDIQAMGRRAVALQADLGVESSVAGLVTRCTEAFGLPSCIVNNASLFDYDEAQSFSYARLNTHMQINVAAPVSLSRDLHRARTQSTHAFEYPAVVINLLDQKLLNPNPDFLSYTLSKAALLEATRLLAQALAPHVRVVGLAPGITLVSGDQTETSFKQAHNLTPLGKSSTPEDITAAAVYLARAHAVTGTTLYVDGGQHLKASARDVMFLTS
jgi:NAD(P)-dependent dehydrogenase (short-subunit alcohol dehydrogenase family)